MPNAGDKVEIEKADESAKKLRVFELADWKTTMSSAVGRRVINRILEKSEVMGEIFSPNGSVTNLNLGKRKVGLYIYGELEQACPELFLLMRQEYIKENSDG